MLMVKSHPTADTKVTVSTEHQTGQGRRRGSTAPSAGLAPASPVQTSSIPAHGLSRPPHQIGPNTASAVEPTPQPLQGVIIDALPQNIVCMPYNGGKLYHSTLFPMPLNIQKQWEDSYEALVSDELMSLKGRNDFYTECLLAGDSQSPERWMPSIIIGCQDKKRRKKAGKLFQTKIWLDRLTNRGLKLRVIECPSLCFLANVKKSDDNLGTDTHLSTLPTIALSVGRPGSQKSIFPSLITEFDNVGDHDGYGEIRRSSLDYEPVATIGGLILAEEKLYGLTVGHPFILSKPTPLFDDSTDDDSSSVYSSDTLDKTPIMDPEHHLSADLGNSEAVGRSPSKTASGHEQENHSKKSLLKSSGTLVALARGGCRAASQSLLSQHAIVGKELVKHMDWGLVELQNSYFIPNYFVHPVSLTKISIEGIEPQARLSTGEVCVVGGRTGAQMGTLNGISASVIIDRMQFSVRRVQLQKTLVRGDSGSWVIRDGKACGVIIVGSEVLPWAYMLPMEEILDSISRTLNLKETCVPSSDQVKQIRRILHFGTPQKADIAETAPNVPPLGTVSLDRIGPSAFALASHNPFQEQSAEPHVIRDFNMTLKSFTVTEIHGKSFTTTSGFRTMGRRFTSLGVTRRPSEVEDLRGPLGLHILFDPLDPLVEFIFVHGLGGGSRKTWSYSDDPASFWPKEWLPQDDAFQHVRTHSFGYNADYTERRLSITNVHDFGKALLESIQNAPRLRRSANVNPIVCIGHSMGGLVVKKAFNLSKQNPEYQELSRRFHSFYFLATPHRGADNAQMLNNMLRAFALQHSRQYVADLENNSGTLEAINDDFCVNCRGTRLFSFYETIPTNLMVSNTVIVEKRSAVLGFAEERAQLMNTDHRHICKFESVSDPNYVDLRNALAATVDDIVQGWSDPATIHEQMRALADYLGISEAEEDELLIQEEKEVLGSCQWLIQKDSFVGWRDHHPELDRTDTNGWSRVREAQSRVKSKGPRARPCRFFWLYGNPGTGKSVLASHVVRHLSQNRDCSYYFIKHNDRSRQSLSTVLRSIAYQMADKDAAIRRALLSMQQDDGLTAEMNDVRGLWRQIFVQRIFRIEPQQQHYWVIDALDECNGYNELFPLLAKIDDKYPLSVFLTSRRTLELDKLFQRLPVISEQIQMKDTLHDIRLFLDANRDSLPVNEESEVETLIQKLLTKSDGSFLWACLVLKQLENRWSDKDVIEVLDHVPDEMGQLYQRILGHMSTKQNHEKNLAKALLKWTACALRPLTVEELREALRLDIYQNIARLERAIEAVCGQLLYVDKNGRVQLVHQSARECLISLQKEDLGAEFAIDKTRTHGRFAELCLGYLGNEERSSQQARRGLGSSPKKVFLAYASTYFSEHLVRSPPSIDVGGPLSKLATFLETSVLSWIEFIARSKDLSHLTQTAKNFKRYVEHRATIQSPPGSEMKIIQAWAVDLIHVVTEFGEHLLRDPESIYYLIPPLCPRDTVLYRTFGISPLGLEVVGLSARTWADRISCINLANDRSTALACCDKRFAIGQRSGMVVLYYVSTCQEARRLDHGEHVRQMEFAAVNDWIVCSGKNTVTLWDHVSGTRLWSINVPDEPMALIFSDEDAFVTAATRGSYTIQWATENGSGANRFPWYSEGTDLSQHIRPPYKTYLSSELKLLAVIYRNQPVVLWDLENQNRLGYISGQGGQTQVAALVFNPDPTQNLLAVSFFHGELSIIDLWALQRKTSLEANASALAASSDGKILIAGHSAGMIQIFDFATLNLVHTIKSEDEDIISMAFTSSNLRFLDIRGEKCNVWEPSTLVRRNGNEDTPESSEGESSSFATARSLLVQTQPGQEEPSITALVAHPKGDVLFCGKESGQVAVYSAARGHFLQTLYSHTNTAVAFLDWNQSKELLVSSDSSSKILVYKVEQARSATGSGAWVKRKLMEERIGVAIRQIMLSTDGRYLLVSTATSDQLWTISGQQVLARSDQPRTPSQEWALHPRNKRQLLKITDVGVHVFGWDGPSEAKPLDKNRIPVDAEFSTDAQVRDSGIHCVRFGNEYWAAYDVNPSTRPLIWAGPASTLMSSMPSLHFANAAAESKGIIGNFQSSLVFLDRKGWVCSIQLEGGQDRPHRRHFFIPHDWQNYKLLAMVTIRGDVVFAKDHEVAIVKRGLGLGS